MTKYLEAQVVIVGEGIAGLLAALRASRAGASVILLGLGRGASSWLQGVNVVVDGTYSGDSLRVHRDDILREGYGLNSAEFVGDSVLAASEAFHAVRELGVDFAMHDDRPLLRHASGSTYPRCCYTPGAMWGGRAGRILTRTLDDAGVQRMRLRALRVICEDRAVLGVLAAPPKGGEPVLIGAGAVVLANGGVGNLFNRSTYPSDVGGDSAVLALRAGAELADMEFIQFEPLVGFAPDEISGYVIPTTLFGDGAVMRNAMGERFLLQNRPQGETGIGKEELVRDMVSQASQDGTLPGGGLWLDATAVGADTIERYPWLAKFMRRHEIDMIRSPIAVWPAPHTCLGGVVVDRDRQSRISGLFAAGEAATGMHGAGRLAGGSGTDVLASGWIAGGFAGQMARKVPSEISVAAALDRDYPLVGDVASRDSRVLAISAAASHCLSSAAGILRSEKDLSAADVALHGLRNQLAEDAVADPTTLSSAAAGRILVAQSIVRSARARRESRGAHLRTDYPSYDPKQTRSLLVCLPDGRDTPQIDTKEGESC